MAATERDLIQTTIRGFSRGIILWLVSQKPMSGYGTIKELERLTGQNLSPGVVYPLLYELEKKGFISGKWTQKGGRRIKHYTITESGTSLLARLRKTFEMPVKEILAEFISDKPK
ncbi:MAG: PadR family transcriptional regulator [Candidatus Bathyarchaeia archaeon]